MNMKHKTKNKSNSNRKTNKEINKLQCNNNNKFV